MKPMKMMIIVPFLAIASNAAAQSVNIPGVGRIKISREIRDLQKIMPKALKRPVPSSSRATRDRAPHGEAPAAVAPVANADPNLLRPQQFGDKISLISAPVGSVREAVQIAFTWTYGEGVQPNLQQGKLWSFEAQRRQTQLRDFSMQKQVNAGLADYASTDKINLMNRGLRALAGNGYQESRFWFSRGAELGDAQAMAALGYVYHDGYKDEVRLVQFCQAAFLTARVTRFEHDLDAVNHFCPTAAIDPVMTAAERKANPASIARAKKISAEVEGDYRASVKLTRAAINAAIADSFATPSSAGCQYHMIDGKLQPDHCP